MRVWVTVFYDLKTEIRGRGVDYLVREISVVGTTYSTDHILKVLTRIIVTRSSGRFAWEDASISVELKMAIIFAAVSMETRPNVDLWVHLNNQVKLLYSSIVGLPGPRRIVWLCLPGVGDLLGR